MILAFSISASFASENIDSIQADDDIGQVPISVSDESMDDSSQADESLSAGVEVDSDEINSADSSEVLKEENVGTFAELNETINNNSDSHIDLYKDYDGSHYYNGIIINRGLTIDGHGHVLDASNFGYIFTVKTASKVVFTNLTFKQATQSAITFEKDANVDIINCYFLDNQRECKNTNSKLYGGAIDCKANLVNSRFINVTFARNGLFSWVQYSSVFGGAICVEKDANNNVFENVTFEDNFVRDEGNTHTSGTYSDIGAGIAFLGKTNNNQFVNTTFKGNFNHASLYFTSEYTSYQSKQYGKGQGAGIHFAGQSINTSFVGCLFENNRASAGGAIHFAEKSEDISFIDSKFIGNDVSSGDTEYNYYANPIQNEGEGGAVRIQNGINVLFNNTLFDDNLGRYGGAIYIKQSENVTLINTNFTANQANTAENDLFYGNQVVNPRGGAIYLSSGNNVFFNNVIFDGNKAWVKETSYYYKYTSIEGGAIAIFSASNLVMNNTVFNDNFAKNYGGAISLSGVTDSVLTNLNFTNNHLTSTASAYGGAFYSFSSANNFNLTNINFINNGITAKFSYYSSSSPTSTANGAAAYFNGNNIGVYNVNFINNLLYSPASSIGSGDVCNGIVYLGGSNYTFDEVNFIGNKVQVPENRFVGGSAISAGSSTSGVRIKNVLIENSTSTAKGAVYIRGSSDYVFDNVRFINNTGTEGAAMYATANNITVMNSVFENNSATKSGSAIYLTGSNHTFDNVNFTCNKLYSESSIEGGVLYLSNVKDSVMKNIDIVDNENNGTFTKAAAIYGDKLTGVAFKGLNVINNNGNHSAVVMLKTPSDVNITYSNFTGNVINSTENSYVIYTDGPIVVDHCIFDNNIISYADIYHSASRMSNDYMYVTDCVFNKPSGREIIYVYNAPAYLANMDFDNFTGEFVIYLYSKDSVITDCNFTNNNCTNSAVSLNGNYNNPATVTNVNFINNTGGNRGGAIYADNTAMNLNDVCFENNSAMGSGGSIYMGYSTRVNLEHVTIRNSFTYGDGGAIYRDYSSGYLNMHDSTFENCAADGSGGAIYSYYCWEDNTFDTVTFNNNTATYGGAIYIGGNGYYYIYDSSFTNNTALEDGGAIFIKQAQVTINNTSFIKNNASHGSAIDAEGTLNINNTVFLKNKANSTELMVEFDRYTEETTCYYAVGDNYINAIRSSNEIVFENVTYFEYEGDNIFNTNDKPAVNNYYKANQTFLVQFFDKNDTLLSSDVMNSDMDGRLYLDTAPSGRHHVTITRFDDDYYTSIENSALCIWGDFTLLQRLIDALDDNGVLSLKRTYIYTIGADNMTEGIVINKTNITIDGNGFTINALFHSRIFQLLTDDVKFQNIHFANASGIDGAFIYGINVTNTQIINCSFENSFAYPIEDLNIEPWDSSSVGPILPDPGRSEGKSPSRGGYDIFYPDYAEESDLGGAVYIIGDNLNVVNSNFTRIMARLGGSVFFEGENATFINSRFNSTRAGYGGALYLNAFNVLIDTCDFYNNSASLAGGAILSLGENYTITDSNFTNCYLNYDSLGYIMDIDSYVFSLIYYEEDPNAPNIDNPPIDDPPVILIMPASAKDGYIIENGPLTSGPSAPVGDYLGGGAIYSKAVNVNITKSLFESCYAESLGGAIFADGNNTNITDSEFRKCMATTGGAVFICINANHDSVSDCLFEDNIAVINGGAVSWYGGNGTLKDSTFNRNLQNAVFNPYTSSDNQFDGGGAVFWGGLCGSIDNCNFTDSSVCMPVGEHMDEFSEYLVDYMGGSEEDVPEYVFNYITNVYSYGGAILIRGAYINITNSRFENNSAQSGGAIAVASPNYPALTRDIIPTDQPLDDLIMSNINIGDCKFYDNFAQYAGAVSILGYKINVYNSDFINNTALIAGALNLEGINSTLSNVLFENNYAVVAGAVLSGKYVYDYYYDRSIISGFDNVITNATFLNNGANGAGAVVWLDESGVINDSHFIGNKIINVYDIYSQHIKDCYSFSINESFFMDIPRYSYDLGVPRMTEFIDFAGAVFWYGENGLINNSDFTKSNASFAGALLWRGPEGIVNNSEFSENSAVEGDAILWMGNYGIIDNSIIKDNAGFEIESSASIKKTAIIHTVSETVSESYYSNNDYDKKAILKYEEIQDELKQIYGYDISLVGFTYNKVFISSSSYYRYYNVTYNFMLLVPSYDGYGPDLSICGGAVIWEGDTGLINNSDFINNKNTMGGALFIFGYNLLVENSYFKNNSAFNGGAIYWDGDEGIVINSTFEDNYGFGHAGMGEIFHYSTLTYKYSFNYTGNYWDIKNCNEMDDYLEYILDDISQKYDIYDLKYDSCSFIYVDNGTGTYDVDAVFSFTLTEAIKTPYSNPDYGGAIYWNGYDGLIYDSKFINNSAFKGAAIYIIGDYGRIINSTFADNTAHDVTLLEVVEKQRYVGYDLYTEGYGYTSEVDCDYFVNSHLGEVLDNVTKLYGCDSVRYEGYSFEVFDVEEPEQYGGSKYKVKVTLVFSLINNQVISCPTASAGAAVYIDSETFIDQSTFINNSASCGGAVYVNCERTLINNSVFDGNTAYKSSTVEISNKVTVIDEEVTYYRDYSTDVGPKFGISDAYRYMLDIYDKYDADEIRVSYTIDGYYYGGDMVGYYLNSISYVITLINYGNVTTIGAFGGAVYVSVPETLINASTFNNNYAEHGGAVYTGVNYTIINQDTFNSNNAEYGGALYTNGFNTIVNDSTFELNHAYLGGAVYWSSEEGIVTQSNFFNNSAYNAGAIYYKGNNNRIQDNSIFKYNIADTGSALYVVGTGLLVNSSTLLENQAKSSSIEFVKNVSSDNTLTVHIVFRGNDNFINAMYIQNNVTLEDVTYCPLVNNGNPRVSSLEDGIKINIKLSDSESILTNTYNLTNIDGESTIVVPNLHYGRYLLTVEHEEDNYYTEITKTEIIYVGSATTQIGVVADDIYYRENATIEVRVPLGVSGEFIINVDGKNYTTIFIDKYVGKTVVPNLEGGLHNVTVYFEGNSIYSANSTNTTFTVKPIPTSMAVASKDIHYGEEIPINITFGDEHISGKILVTIEGITGITLEILNSSEISTIIGTLDVGTYNITAFYTGNNNFVNVTNTTNFTVSPNEINAKAIAYDVSRDENSKFVITIPSDFVGKVDINVDGISRTYDVSGSKVITFDKLSEGEKSANLTFYGNINYIDESLIVNFTVTKPDIVGEVFTIHAFNMTRSANSPYDYQAEFLDSNGEVLANAPVSFEINGVFYDTTTNKDGIAQLSLAKLTPGKYNVTCINRVTGDNATMELEVVGRIYNNKDMVMDFRDGSSFVVRVLGDDGKPAPEGEIVSITANGIGYVAKVGKNGYARLKINLNPRKYTVVTEYKGFKTTNTLIVKQTLKLVKKTVKVKKGKKLVLKAKLKWSDGKAIEGEVLKFTFKGKTYSAKTNSKGIAKVILKKKVTKKLKKGKTYVFGVKYFTNAVKGSVKVKK